MNFSPNESDFYTYLLEYASKRGYKLNPDQEMLERIIKGMIKIEENKGQRYCPCRLVTGDKAADEKIICPCVYHEQEIAEHGHCHCYLFFAE